MVGTGGLKIAIVTTQQHTAAFEEAYTRERQVLEQRMQLMGSVSAEPGPSPSRIIANVPFAHLGSDAW